MADIELVVKLDEEEYINIKNAINNLIENGVERSSMSKVCLAILDGTPLPKGHGKIVDIGKIDEDMIDDDNPVIYLTINGEYIEAISLDYLNNLPTIIEADKEQEE